MGVVVFGGHGAVEVGGDDLLWLVMPRKPFAADAVGHTREHEVQAQRPGIAQTAVIVMTRGIKAGGQTVSIPQWSMLASSHCSGDSSPTGRLVTRQTVSAWRVTLHCGLLLFPCAAQIARLHRQRTGRKADHAAPSVAEGGWGGDGIAHRQIADRCDDVPCFSR